MRQILPTMLSIFTIMGMWLVGNKSRWGWIVGLVNQALWVTFDIVFEAWGLIPLSIVLIVIYMRNLRKWIREEKNDIPT